MAGRAAVFVDRDGTIIADPGYLSQPGGVQLLPGAAEAIARLNRAGLPVFVVTNQSGIGRGMYAEAEFQAVQERLEELLAEEGARIDGVYVCPHAPDRDPPCECRKPAPGLFTRAAAEHGLDLARSYFVGDSERDISPASRWGAVAILVGDPAPPDAPGGYHREPSLLAAVDRILHLADVDDRWRFR